MTVGDTEACRTNCLCRGRDSCAVPVTGVAILVFATVDVCMVLQTVVPVTTALDYTPHHTKYDYSGLCDMNE